MRITGGTFGGRNLPSSGFAGIRPTTDRARETIFNILQNHISLEGAQVLDLCAGTGALGFEAMSRGASSVVLVEKHRGNAELLRKSAQMLGVDAETRIVCADCVKAISLLEQPETQEKYHLQARNLIFCDPPYAAKLINPVFQALAGSPFVHAEAVFVAEHDTREVVIIPRLWEKFAERHFGETQVEFFRR